MFSRPLGCIPPRTETVGTVASQICNLDPYRFEENGICEMGFECSVCIGSKCSLYIDGDKRRTSYGGSNISVVQSHMAHIPSIGKFCPTDTHLSAQTVGDNPLNVSRGPHQLTSSTYRPLASVALPQAIHMSLFRTTTVPKS